MAKDSDITKLLKRCVANGLGRNLNDQELSDLANEWLKTLGGCNAEMLDKALTEYIANDTKAYARLPKVGELRQIYNNLLDEQRRKTSLNYNGKCPLCLGFGKALVEAAEPFLGNYGSLGIVCPCRHNGEMQALERGLHLTRRIKGGTLEFWLDGPRILGKLKVVQKKEPAAKADPSRQQDLRPAFDDLPF